MNPPADRSTAAKRARGLKSAIVSWSFDRHAAALVRRLGSLPRPGGFLPVLLIGVLLLCHGVLGFTHQIPHGCEAAHPLLIAASADEHVAGDAGGHAVEDPACEHMFTGYFAVVLALFGAAVLGLLLGPQKRRVTVSPPSRSPSLPAFAHPSRGPTFPLLQVFRL